MRKLAADHHPMPPTNWHGCRVTVMGLGRFGGGLGAARWLARQGAEVTVTDLADAQALAEPLARLHDVPLAGLQLGGHREQDFLTADCVVVNPAVRPQSPYLDLARRHGAPLTTEIGLLIEHCPAPIIGVTGSNGKSTTAAMIAAILRANGRRAWLGGNLGGSLLDDLSRMQPSDWVVLELSSFQLHYLAGRLTGPRVGVVTGFSPNHLDWHGSLRAYRQAKQQILAGQGPEDVAVLNPADPELRWWEPVVRGRLAHVPPESRLPALRVPGEHNHANAALAVAAARAAGCRAEAAQEALASFAGLAQRLEWVGVVAGRRFYNDSAATTPESTAAAIQALAEPVWLLAGGRDKGLRFEPLVRTIVERCRGAAFYGEMGQGLYEQTRALNAGFACCAIETLEAAFAWCVDRSRAGDAILFSPACASTDQFADYRQRGRRFVELLRVQTAGPLARCAEAGEVSGVSRGVLRA